ncbi:tumor necrosis factor receptor superfamily member 13B [Trichomycterus rosablanca]|uniref:tumor necrosis factor receptor superfamily member 13B n=1 Tax=Trichomycterus rosablanca TaxID=2290929 RepID=UPI002F3555BC
MTPRCQGGQFWDGLVKKCMTCEMVCYKPEPPNVCSDFCVAYECKIAPGHFYDSLLKKCLKCSELCGHHPTECSKECLSNPNPLGVSVVPQLITKGRGDVKSVPYSEVLVYSLLGLCFALLLSTMLMTVLVLLKRARENRDMVEKKDQQPDEHTQSSKDCLMAAAVTQEVTVIPDRLRATETCVCCFSEQARTQPTLYQQAVPQYSAHRQTNGSAHGHVSSEACRRDDVPKIICSPTQTST